MANCGNLGSHLPPECLLTLYWLKCQWDRNEHWSYARISISSEFYFFLNSWFFDYSPLSLDTPSFQISWSCCKALEKTPLVRQCRQSSQERLSMCLARLAIYVENSWWKNPYCKPRGCLSQTLVCSCQQILPKWMTEVILWLSIPIFMWSIFHIQGLYLRSHNQ